MRAIMDFGLFNTWNALYEGGKVPWDPDYRGGKLLEEEAYARNWEEVKAEEEMGWDYMIEWECEAREAQRHGTETLESKINSFLR
jgi:G:T-mismatch repair DNA endonuclease (very short patch repair protein)